MCRLSPFAALAGCLISFPALLPFSATAVEPTEEVDHADHEALRALRAVFEKAASENQLDLLEPYLDQPFSVVTFTDREFTDFDVFKAQWQKTRDRLLAGGSYSVKLNPELSRLHGDLALCKGSSDNVLRTGSGQEYRFKSNWTAVCRKVDGKWKIVRAHSSLDPFGNPMVLAGAKDAVIKGVVIAGVCGLILGGLIHALWVRRRAGKHV
jgi:ketosteroid isomerase-like protein